MSVLLTALLGTMLLPLFAASWRISLLGLALQGLLLGWIAHRFEPNTHEVGWWLNAADFVVVRGVVVPAAIHAVLRVRTATGRHEIIPPNLLSWALVFACVMIAYQSAEYFGSNHGDDYLLLAVAGSGLLLGLMVLSTQTSVFGQVVAVLRMENAIALFELGGHGEQFGWGLRAGLLGTFVATVFLMRWYLATVRPVGDEPAANGGLEEPTL